jgi:hypothetical protein
VEEPHNIYQNLPAGSIHQQSKISKTGLSDYRSEKFTNMTEHHDLSSGVGGEASQMNRTGL